MTLRQLIYSDLERLCHPTFKNFLKFYFFPGGSTFPYQVWLRVWICVKKEKILKFLFSWTYVVFRHFTFKYGINVNTGMTIGPGLCIAHGYGVFLNCKEIGAHFTCSQNVTLGINGGGYPLLVIM